MARVRRSREWGTQTVEHGGKSGLKARADAEREGLSATSLWWWSSELGHGNRAKRGSTSPVALEVQLAEPVAFERGAAVEIEAFGAVIRLPVGTDAAYVATLVRSLAGR